MAETITHIEDEVRSDSGEESRFSKEKKAGTKTKDEEQKKKEQKTEGFKEKELSFRDAKEITRLGFNILHGNDLLVSRDELRYFGELLKKHGHNPGEVDRMVAQGDQKILEIAFSILREANVDEAKENDWSYAKGSENRRNEEKSVRELMRQVKNLAPEALTVDQIRKRVVIDEFKKFDIEAKGGPGTAEAGEDQESDTLDSGASKEIIDLLSQMMGLAEAGRNVATDTEWNQLSQRLNQEIEDFNQAYNGKKFSKVYEFGQSVQEFEVMAERKQDALKAVLSTDTRLEIQRKLKGLDEEFKTVYNKMSENQRSILFKDITLAMGTEKQGILQGWRSYDEAKGHIFGREAVSDDLKPRFGEGIVIRGASKERVFGTPGIRDWRATKELFGAQESVAGELLRRAPAQWEEVPQSLSNIYRLIESTDFSLEDLQHELQQAYQMLDSIQATTPERRETRDKLSKELDAFRAFHSFRVSMGKEDMDPTRMMDTFKHYFDDETWQNFVARFAHDERIRNFVIARGDGKLLNEENEAVEDAKEACEKINIFDEAFSIYSERLRQERVSMNLVEEMTRHEIGHEYSNGELEEFARWTGMSLGGMNKEEQASFKQQVEKLRVHFVGAMEEKIADTHQHNPNSGFDNLNVDDVWGRKRVIKTPTGKEIKCIRLTQNIIQEWHQKETLHGAVGDKRRIRRKEMVGEIKDRLEKIGLKVRKTGGEAPSLVDFEEFEQSGLLDSADANAYHTTWMFEWTPYDSIRIYSRDSKSQLDDDFDDLVFHQETNVFFGRQVDHAWEFYHETNENRGRPKENEVNRIWKQYLPGKHHYLFPQNMAMVRWSYDAVMTDDQKAEVDRRTQELMGKYDFDHGGLAHDDFVAWMRNVAVMDMIENGRFSFGQKKFSEMCKTVKKFEMIDLFSDRMKNKVYSDPDNFQSYLANPTMDRFMALNNRKNFYSTRPARQHPWMTLALRAHWEIVNKHSRRLFDREDVQSEVMETNVKKLVADGNINKETAVDFKRKNLGFLRLSPHGNQDELPPISAQASVLPAIVFGGWARKGRQFLENSRRFTWEARFTPFFFIGALIFEIIRRMPGQATGGQSRS